MNFHFKYFSVYPKKDKDSDLFIYFLLIFIFLWVSSFSVDTELTQRKHNGYWIMAWERLGSYPVWQRWKKSVWWDWQTLVISTSERVPLRRQTHWAWDFGQMQWNLTLCSYWTEIMSSFLPRQLKKKLSYRKLIQIKQSHSEITYI